MNKINLGGTWDLYMDKTCKNRLPKAYNDNITLPDTTSHAQKGERSTERNSGHLTDPYRFEGNAWFGRDFDVLPEWNGKELYLRLERTRITTLYVDRKKLGSCDSLCTSHLYKLPQLAAGTHRLDICVNNTEYLTKGGHMTSPDTQTNWNGITGAIELLIRPQIHIDDIKILSETSPEKIVFSCTASGNCEAYVTVSGGKTDTIKLKKGNNRVEYVPEQALPTWDEFSPALNKLAVSVNGEMRTVNLGIRKITADGRKLLVNGHETFLRGKHDGMLFPITGYAPTDVDSWIKILSTAKAFGINHYRFHTCCPPNAAFTAADRLGIYMQPELPFWGTVEDELTGETRWLIDEGLRILDEFGNHPSFIMMSLGNELWGSKTVLNDILGQYKSKDERHLYTDGSNNFQFMPCVLENADFFSGVRFSYDRLIRGSYAMCDAPQGFIQTDEPNTIHCYDSIIAPENLEKSENGGKVLIQYGTGVKQVDADGSDQFIPEVPVISHEIGQYETYPDYTEIEKYTGVLKAENIELYREKADEKGVAGYTDKFFRASGALAVNCYKREIEAALKSSELSGFQLLDIQDFTGQGTALVGVLNAFMEPKGTATAEKWREFCAPTVIMAEFEKFVFSSNEDITFGVTLFNTDPAFSAERLSYTIECGGSIELYGYIGVKCSERVNRLGNVVFKANYIKKPTPYKLTLCVEKTEIRNTYEFFIYPDTEITVSKDMIECGSMKVKIAHSEEQARYALEKGIKTLYIPDNNGKLEGTYCTDFWCYPMFCSISESMNKPVPVGTMGLLIDSKDKLLSDFPCEDHTTAQWFNIVMHSHCENLDGTDIIPTVWVIDNPDRAEKLGLLYRIKTGFGDLTVCTSKLWEIGDKPEVKWFVKSIAENI